jgi:hypothetical protein
MSLFGWTKKRTYSIPGIPDLLPSDVKMGWPREPDVPDGKAHFGIEVPTGAFVMLTHPTQEGARMFVEGLKDYLGSHTVSGNQQSIDKMIAAVDQIVSQRMNKSR